MSPLVHLRDFRKSLNLSQREMAATLNISLSMYEKVERGYIQASGNFIFGLKKKYPEINIEKIFFN